MATVDISILDNNESSVCVERTMFPVAINEALEDCARAHELILTFKNGLEEVPAYASSPVYNYCNIRLHVNDALSMLSSEQRNEVSIDLHNLQGELVRTYTSCQAAEQVAYQGLRQAIENDSILRNDSIAIQCVDTIEEQSQRLEELPPTFESLEERRSRMGSIRENLNILEERTEAINPNGPLSKMLKLFQKLFSSITHTLSSVIKTIRYQTFSQ